MRPPKIGEGGPPDIAVWDTHYIPQSKAFSVYRDALCSVYMPWTATTESTADFEGRFETSFVKGGTMSRSRCSAMHCVREKHEVSHSEEEFIWGLYVLSGYHACEQNDRSLSAGPGELIIIDSSKPCRVETGGPDYGVIVISVPKAELRGIKNIEDSMGNVVITHSPLTTPLLSCANLIAKDLVTSASEEREALYDAYVTLLPLATGCFEDENKEDFSARANNSLTRAIQEFADHRLSDPQLCVQMVADHFGISVRYVHKLFAILGTTFNAYVTASRLENVRRDLLSPTAQIRNIAELAFRWGFSDLSTFNRSFKRRFGCAPTQYRARSD